MDVERKCQTPELKEGYPYAYVWNREEEFGEIGSIQIKMEQGGLVRVA